MEGPLNAEIGYRLAGQAKGVSVCDELICQAHRSNWSLKLLTDIKCNKITMNQNPSQIDASFDSVSPIKLPSDGTRSCMKNITFWKSLPSFPSLNQSSICKTVLAVQPLDFAISGFSELLIHKLERALCQSINQSINQFWDDCWERIMWFKYHEETTDMYVLTFEG